MQIRWLWRRHEHQTKLREFIYEEVFTFDFNNFMCIISSYIIILKFIQIPWPDVHMNNLEECFYGVLTNFILLHKKTCRQEVFCKKGFLRNFVTFTGKHLCQSLFLNKDADVKPGTLFKKRLWQRCFSVNFAKFLRTPFLTEHLWWLLLNISSWFQWRLLRKISCKEFLRSSIKQG